MDKQKKLDEIKRNLPIFWNSYQHMYDIRKTNLDNSVNFLLVVISFMSATTIGFLAYFKNEIFLIPISIQIIAFIILFKKFFINEDLLVHWFEHKTTFDGIDKNYLTQITFASLKALENYTNEYLTEIKKIIKSAILVLLSSLISMILAIIFSYFREKTILYLLASIISIAIIFVCYYYHKQPRFNEIFKRDFNNILKETNEWLDKK